MIKNLILNKTTIPLLKKGLNVYSLRQKVISSNIANINTPDYQRKEVRFEEKLRSAIRKEIEGRRTNPAHLPLGKTGLVETQPELVTDDSPELASGVNNVDIDKEIVEQMKNEIRYVYATRMLAKNFAAIRASIKGRFDR